jgi:hypothetical protein
MKAIVYQTGNDGVQRRVCEIEVQNGAAVAVGDHPLGKYIVGRSVVDYRAGELDARAGEQFLRALPAAYSGQRLRVGLEETEKDVFDLDEKFNPIRDQLGRFASGGGGGPMMAPDTGGGGGGGTVEQTMSPKTKSEIAKASAKRVDKEIQRYSEERNEPKLAKALGGKSLADNEPVDVVTEINGKKHGIELKTMVDNKHNKLTMKKDAQARKRSWERREKGKVHTVVFDDQKVFNAKGPGKHDEPQRRILYRRGYGSFRTDGMYEVKGGMEELRQLLSMDKRKLPKGAK